MRKALITGGGRRIGRAIVERLAADGWAVAVHYNDSAEEAEAAVAAIRSAGGTACALGADLADEAQVRALAAEAGERLGGLDAVVNNASAFGHDALEDDGREQWDRHMELHVRAPYVLARALYLGLAEGAMGAVVNVVDQRVLNPTKHFISYSISKMALWDQTQVLARAMAPSVRVNAVAPGPVLPSSRQSADDFARQARQTPLGHAAEPAEVAAATAFLLDAPSVTGQIIAIDAGQHLNWAYETDETAPTE